MEQEQNFFAESKAVLGKYIQDRILLLKLQSAEKISKLVALMFTGIIIALLCFFILLFLSIMGGYYFASVTGSMFAGFGIIAGVYLILLIVMLILGKNFLTKFITNLIIRIFFDQKSDEDDNDDNQQ